MFIHRQLFIAVSLAVLMGIVPRALSAAPLKKLPEAASDSVKRWAVVFDFDTDSCYPSPAIFPTGQFNPGLSVTGIDTTFVAGCRDVAQLEDSNTYHRVATIRKDGKLFAVRMYALYFMKDKDLPLHQAEGAGGHRHDWEFALVWLTNNVLTHASFSAHGHVTTKPAGELRFEPGVPEHVKVVYHKNSVSTHAMRFAGAGDAEAENALGQWVTPTIVDWRSMRSDVLDNAALRQKLNDRSFGEANCSVNDANFPLEISKSPPPGYPSAEEWKRAALQIPTWIIEKPAPGVVPH
jgi:hypothetical protein